MTTQLKRIKPYKAKPPLETINKIRDLLSGLGIYLVEKPVEGSSFFKASVLSIINPENKHIVFSTYGKGKSLEWASASAWGEMLERIQNLAFYMVLIYPTKPEYKNSDKAEYTYFPDEKTFSLNSDSDILFIRNFKDLTGIIPDSSRFHHDVVGVPFYSVFEKRIEYFPFRALQVIVGSNGMCSGNTRDEALIQGISEIFERHVLKTFYLEPFCPPDIPLDYFEDSEIALTISQLENQYGYRIQIKDCSMGKAYPVIGVLIRNGQDSYAFHLGADPSPITALERCFTEMYQGENICFQSISELNENSPYNLKTTFWRKNLSLTIRAYAGHWSPSILNDEPNYEFSGFNHPESVTDCDDLNYLLNILKKENRKIFIRDNSFLGLPAYYVFVPGMSEISNLPDNTFSSTYLDFDNYLPALANLKKTTSLDRAEMINILLRYIEASPVKQFKTSDYFKYNQTHPIAQLSSEQFLDLLEFSVLEGNILNYFDEKEIKANPFLNSIYVNKAHTKPTEIFNYLNIPDCFECSTCSHKNCNLPFISLVWEQLQEIMKSTMIDQNSSLDMEYK